MSQLHIHVRGEMDPKDEGLLILKSSSQSMKSVEIYLKNREWKLASTDKLKETIQLLLKYRPKYMLLPADHPNPKVKMLPKILMQVMKVVIIGYTESNSTKAANQLQSLGLEYVLYPPVSGPQIERFFAKVQKEQQERQAQAEQDRRTQLQNVSLSPKPAKGDASDGLTQLLNLNSLTAPAEEESSTIVVENPHQASIDNLLAQLLADPEVTTTQPDKMIVVENSHQASVDSILAGIFDELDNTSPETISGEPQTNTFDAVEVNSAPTFVSSDDMKKSTSGLIMPENSGDAKKSEMMITKGGSAKTNGFAYSPQQNQTTKGGFNQANDSVNTFGQNPPGNSDAQKTKGGFTQQENPFGGDLNSKTSGGKKALKYETDPDSEITHTFSSPADNNSDQFTIEEPTSKIACMVIDSSKFKGYLIAALGKSRQVDDLLNAQIRIQLVEYLKTRGETPEDFNTDTMSFDIKPVQFQAWARDQAEFLQKSVAGEDEIAMAFFPTADLDLSLENSAQEHMLQMGIDDIGEDTPLEFDIFIYLPTNGKYIRYNKEGNKMFGDQKGRLKKNGITHIHMKKDAEVTVRKYKARNYLNSKIAAFETGNKKKKTA